MKLKILTLSVITLVSLGSCKKWIDVKPSDRLSESMLFSSKEGFLKSLNGVYVELNNTALYGQNLSMGMVDVLAQYYYMTGSTHAFYDFTMFNYGSANNKTGFDNTWKKAYELIVNCNVIIAKCDEHRNVLPSPYYEIVKGEAYALRAMLHFDILRLFGPIWTEESKPRNGIPYNTFVNSDLPPMLTNEKSMEAIIKDFETALALLEIDPIITEGVRNAANVNGSNDFYFRQYRLNYFAVKGLMARAYMWMGDAPKALQTALAVINDARIDDKDIFPPVAKASATHAEKPDRMFSTEVLFSLYTINRTALYDNLFSPNQDLARRLSFNLGNADKARVDGMYDDANDYRLRIWEVVNGPNGSILTNQKYRTYVDAPGQNMIPLLRMAEMYLIASECSDDINTAKQYLNTLRTNRNVISLAPTNEGELRAALTAEYRREMIGEGQQFFYYKRNAFQSIPNHAALIGNKTMVLDNYKVPFPDSEISLRNN